MKRHNPAFLALVERARGRIREIDAVQLATRLVGDGAPVVLDVREPDEFERGHIAGSVLVPRGILERDIESLYPDRSAEIALYCGGGYRSALAADALQQMGYKRVCSLAGGWRAWTAHGGPVDGAASDP